MDVPFIIRPARSEEAQALTDLSLRSKAVWGYEASFMARCRAVMTLKVAAIEAQPHYVAEADGRLLGFYGFEPEKDGVGLDYLFVAPEAIGRGVGRALWEHAVATARQLGHATLIVVSDPNAEGFYRRMGARPAGAQPSDLEPGRWLPVLRFPLG
ncbi:GNAT family N-acetyltransferase [Virgifigura deserti]|uniref:GNAT family N-acetyltransferase n=1 Tax=Virgifigura deserti TaxID=2268457 RepID=UPI003CCBAE63